MTGYLHCVTLCWPLCAVTMGSTLWIRGKCINTSGVVFHPKPMTVALSNLYHFHWIFGCMYNSAPMNRNCEALILILRHCWGAVEPFFVSVCGSLWRVPVNIVIYDPIIWAMGPLCKILPLIGFSDELGFNSFMIAVDGQDSCFVALLSKVRIAFHS